MRYNGKIKNLNHIVVSDPSYKKETWCRYEKDNLKEKDWIVNLDISHKTEKIEDFNINYMGFSMLIKKDNNVCDLTKEGISYLKGIKLQEYQISMDTACVALGINNKAKKIIDSQDEWQPNCSIKTGIDGFFGEVMEGKDSNNNLCFIFISGDLDNDMGYDIDFLKEYLVNQFEIIDLTKEDVILDGDNKVLNKGDKGDLEL